MAGKATINMQHGFMQSIIKNQVDRDNYDKEVRQKQAEQVATVKEHKPEIATYQPPSRRANGVCEDNVTPDTASGRLFQFHYEDQNGNVHNMDVMKGDNAQYLARRFGKERNLNQAMTRALADFLRTEIRKALKDTQADVS